MIQTKTETPHIQITDTTLDTTLITAQETLLIIEVKIILLTVIEIAQITDHKIFLKRTI